jgi:hypothetical protein
VDADALTLPLPVQRLAASVAKRHLVTTTALLGDSHRSEVVRARREFWRILQDSWGLTTSEMARLIGADRTSILVGVRRSRKEAGL